MAETFQVELLQTEQALQDLRPEWEALYATTSPRNPFLSFDWTLACREHHCPESELLIVTLREAGRLMAVAPLRRDRELGFRVLRFLGDGRSDYLGLLLLDGRTDLQSRLLEGLRRLRSEWDLAILRQLAGPYTRLAAEPPVEGLESKRVAGTVAPHLRFDGEWDALLATGPGWLRRMSKAARKWVKDGGSVARIPGDRAFRYVDQVAEIEAASWKGAEGVARFQPGRGQRLLREALATLGARNEMELWLAWKDERPVAFEVNFVMPDRIWLYQGAYRTEYRKYSPGGVLDFLSIERAWSQGAREYDFMSGDEPYKMERTTEQRAIRYLALYPADTRGRLAFQLVIASRWRLKDCQPVRVAHQRWSRWRGRAPRSNTVPQTSAEAVG